MENFHENAVFKAHISWQAGTISRVFQTVLAVQEIRFFFFRFLIIPYKKLYRKQPVEFLIKTYGYEIWTVDRSGG